MKINSINSTNFTGIYKLKNTPSNVQEIQEHVMPMYNQIRHEAFSFFIGTNPFKANLLAAIQHIAQENGASVSWLKLNAKNNGLDITDVGENTIYVITGNCDNESFNTFLAKRLLKRPLFFEKISQKIQAAKQKANLPEHLQPLIDEIIPDKEEDVAFQKFAPQIIEVETPYNLLQKSFSEK